MNDMARLMPNDRAVLFGRTAPKTGIPATLVEKDFWVCWTLKHLFGIPELQDCLIFKGGTTLSKVYGIINRFSEDIDLTLDRCLIGITTDTDPAKATGTKDRQRRLMAMGEACRDYVQRTLLEQITKDFSKVLGHLPELSGK